MTTGGPLSASSREDELLSLLYQQITEQQAARFGAGYDIAAGLDRYRTWLRDHAAGDHPGLEASRAEPARALRAGGTGISSVGVATGPGQAAAAETAISRPAHLRGEILGAEADRDADSVIVALYGMHYRSMVRLAALLVHDIATAEEVVQDSFIALHAGLHRLRDPDKALAYLRAAVVNRSRSVLRHRVVVDRNAPAPAPDLPSAEHGQLAWLERSAVISALRSLPVRQREVVVLRFYVDLSEAQIASALGITRGAVKSHTSQAMSLLRAELRKLDE
jgi:RNA polymerase sigma-70 factor (sigma-E family)